MKFRVTGANRDTGARMVLEFEAESKAAAERKATQSGMSVSRVESVSEGYVGHTDEPRASRRSSGPNLKPIIVVVILAAVLWYLYRNGTINRLLRKAQSSAETVPMYVG